MAVTMRFSRNYWFKYNKQEEVDGLVSRGSSSSLDENHYTDGSEAKPLSLQEFMAEASVQVWF